MPKLHKVLGATSEIWQIFIRDSSSTTGAGLTGLAYNSSGLSAYYHRDTDTSATAITLADMTVGSFTSSGFKKIDDTNMPGWYQFCPPNAALASGAKSCAFLLKGATNMAPVPIEVQLVAVNPDDAVRMGMTALPNAAAEAAGGLYTRGTGAGQIAQDANGNVRVNVDTIKTNAVVNGGTITFPTNSTLASTTNITGGTVTTATNVTNVSAGGIAAASFAAGAIDSTAIAADAIGASEIAADAITSSELAASAANEIADALLDRASAVDGYTTRQAMRLILAALAGKLSGAATTTVVIRDAADAKDRITATVDSDGNRSAVTLDAT